MTMTPEHRLTLKRLRQARPALVKAGAMVESLRRAYSLPGLMDFAMTGLSEDITYALEATDHDDKGKA
jgi:hypothetical protein